MAEGSIFRFLSPNGADKNTALRIITGLAQVTAGPVHVLGRHAARSRTDMLLRTAGLHGVTTPIGGYSRGMKQRLGIAQALVHTVFVALTAVVGTAVTSGVTLLMFSEARPARCGLQRCCGWLSPPSRSV